MSRPESHSQRRFGTPGGAPSRVRHGVVFACALMSVLLYLDRFCVSIAEPYIKQDLGLSTFQFGFFFSAFFLAYALCQVPSGWLTDRYGARIMLVIYVLTWSFFTAMMGLSYGFAMLLLMRAAYGVGQAGAYPTSASVISKWVPFSNRGTASSYVAFGGRLGGAVAPLLTAFLIVWWVPVTEESSRFHSKDLLDGPALCSRISPPSPAESAMESTEETPRTDPTQPLGVQRVWELLPAESQRVVRTIAEAYRPIEPKIRALEQESKSLQGKWFFFAAQDKFREAESLRIRLDPSQRALLVTSLNRLVADSDFYRRADFADLSLDRSASGFHDRVDRGETLTPAESERLNRLLLEALFPGIVGEVYVSGWRPVMISYGLVGIVVAALLWVVLRNRPELHPRCNPAEVSLIAAGRPPGAPSPHGKAGGVPWGPILKSRSLWFSSIAQVGTNIGWLFLLTWFPRYLIDVHEVPIIQRGLMTTIPPIVGWVGMLGGGRLTDALVPRIGLRWGRRLPWVSSRVIGAAAFLACPWLDSPWAITAALSFVAFATDLGNGASWAFCQDVGGRYVGSILGWGNMWGNLGATISPILLAWVFESLGWDEVFYVCAGAFTVSGLMALGVDATIPIAPRDDDL